jgi:hypothetical protein
LHVAIGQVCSGVFLQIATYSANGLRTIHNVDSFAVEVSKFSSVPTLSHWNVVT